MRELWWKRSFQTLVTVSVFVHIVVALLPGRGNLADGLLVINFSLLIGLGLVKFNPIARFLLLLTVISVVLSMSNATEYLMFEEPYKFPEMGADPTTLRTTLLLMLLEGIVLTISYVTPVTYEFEAYLKSHMPTSRSIGTTVIRSDGAMLACVTLAFLVFFLVNEIVISLRYQDSSLTAKITKIEEALKTTEYRGNKREMASEYQALGDLYWSSGENEKATLMYEQYLALIDAGVVPTLGLLNRTILRLTDIYSTESDEKFGDGREALEMANRYKATFGQMAEIHNLLAIIYARLGQFDNAARYQRLAVQECLEFRRTCDDPWGYAERLKTFSDGKVKD